MAILENKRVMDNNNITIRNLETEDIPAAMELVLAEGWNQTENDWRLFLSHPGNVCKCAEKGGKVVGTTTSYNFSDKVAWISMVLVHKNFRGLGISKMLLNSVLNELKNCKSIKLDATPAGRNVYRQFGFVEEYRISRMINNSFKHSITLGTESSLKIMKADVANIIEFDHNVFGGSRPHLIKAWISDNPKNSWIIKHQDQISGFVLGRKGNRFFQIGPVSAKNEFEAKALILQVLNNLTGEPVVIDIMMDKTTLADWLTTIGFEKRREFTRMFYKGNSFPGNKTKQFVIGGPEFG